MSLQTLSEGFFNAAQLAALLFVAPAFAQETPEPSIKPALASSACVGDRTAQLRQIHLMSTAADIRIVGIVADVRLTQTVINGGDQAIAARQALPSTGHTPYAVSVTAAGIKQSLRRAGSAETACDSARDVLISPGASAVFEQRYTEALTRDRGVYHLALHGDEQFTGAARTALSLRAVVDSPLSIKAFTSPTHPVQSEGVGETHALMQLENTTLAAGQDFELALQLAGKEIEAGALVVEQDEDKFVLVMVEPPLTTSGASEVELCLRGAGMQADFANMGTMREQALIFLAPLANLAMSQAMEDGGIEMRATQGSSGVWKSLVIEARISAADSSMQLLSAMAAEHGVHAAAGIALKQGDAPSRTLMARLP